MKGLLIKDLKLLKNQKNFFFMVVLIALVLSVTGEPSFIIGYMTFIGFLAVLSSISYDEYDNGFAFLMTLPVRRKTYVKEKYFYGIGLGGLILLISTGLAYAISFLKDGTLPIEFLYMMLCFFPMGMLLIGLTIPLQLKYGAEKSRVALFALMAMIMILIIGGLKLLEFLNIDGMHIIEEIVVLSLPTLIIGIVLSLLLFLVLSYRISLIIMDRKEF